VLPLPLLVLFRWWSLYAGLVGLAGSIAGLIVLGLAGG
jgi:hypothetical protein